jgi:hypothetical protein
MPRLPALNPRQERMVAASVSILIQIGNALPRLPALEYY